jgi:tetratricopeptide (TPR) repeat protein
VKYSFVGFSILGFTVGTAFEAAHQWVEHREMVLDRDQSISQWEWDMEAEKWSGGSKGGTDTALGFYARHSVRAAWIALNWGNGRSSPAVTSSTFNGFGPHIVEIRLQRAHEFLRAAIGVADERAASGQLSSRAISELLIRHANVLERMGFPEALLESRSQLLRAWAGFDRIGNEAARIALKLGDISTRLGDSDGALSWWSRALSLAQGRNDDETTDIIPPLLESVPKSPMAQRTLASTLVSLSAFYAKDGQLSRAQEIGESSLSILRSISPSTSTTNNSLPQALHALYLLHRSSVLSIHLAEVLFALHHPVSGSIQYLQSAAISSERVALALTGLPQSHPDASLSQIPHPPASEVPLLQVYMSSNSMRRPASSLLRSARRTAAESWNLLGVLSEDESPEKALECYERALGWIGVKTDKVDGPGGIHGEAVLEDEYNSIWKNYVKVRELVREKDSNVK